MTDKNPSRRAQREEQKAALYATTDEKAQVIRRRQQVTDRYTPHVRSDQWRGQAWGLATAQVKNRQKKTKELYYGEKRAFSLDAPPEDPVNSFLARKAPEKKPTGAPAAGFSGGPL